jgi:hypothetical protein
MDERLSLKEIETLTGLLNQSGISTLEDLKRCIVTNADHGIGWVASQANASQSSLVALLVADMRDDPTRSDNRELLHYWRALKTFPARRGLPTLKRNWLDLIVFAVLPIMLIGLGFRAYSINKTVVPYVRVKAPSGLPIFHKINDEVEIAAKPGAEGALTSLDKARNRYTLVPIAAGAALKEDALLSAELSNKMKDRKILTLSLGAGGQDSGLPIPREATLVLSPKEFNALEKESVSFGVIVLRIDKKGDSSIATVALPGDQFDRAARLLASHDVFLAQPLQ